MLKSPSGKIYIGQTIRPIEKRFKSHQHKNSACSAIYNAIQKYGWDNFEKDWYECPDEDLNFDEELLVREMKTLSPDGYNLKEGGDNGKMSKETKQKMSEAKLGKTLSDDHKQNISKAQIGHTVGEKTRHKIREARVGIPRSEQSRKRHSDSIKCEKNHNFGKTGDKNITSKRVYKYALDGTFINSFGSTEEAGRHLNKKSGSLISRCALGKEKTAYGFKWSYIRF